MQSSSSKQSQSIVIFKNTLKKESLNLTNDHLTRNKVEDTNHSFYNSER